MGHACRGRRSLGGATTFWEVGAGAAEVESTNETGEVNLAAYATVAMSDARSTRPCEGQDEAPRPCARPQRYSRIGVRGGQLLNPNIIDYRLPPDDRPARERFHRPGRESRWARAVRLQGRRRKRHYRAGPGCRHPPLPRHGCLTSATIPLTRPSGSGGASRPCAGGPSRSTRPTAEGAYLAIRESCEFCEKLASFGKGTIV